MKQIPLQYTLEEKLPFGKSLLYGIQWLAIIMPSILIIGSTVAKYQFQDPLAQIMYTQKLFFITSIATLLQVIWGHRLPLFTGPAAVLLIGMMAAQGNHFDAIYTSILLGGLLLFLINITGLFVHIQKLFTPRVVATILLLIAFTLIPMIMNLILDLDQKVPAFNMVFALIFIFLLFIADKLLHGIWKSTLMIWALLLGTITYLLLAPYSMAIPDNLALISMRFFTQTSFHFNIQFGILLSFLMCFLALSINDLGSIQSVNGVIKPNQAAKRLKKGISWTGLTNIFAGLFGVIGQVNFSVSPGVIATTRCASRFPFIPATLILLFLSFCPGLLYFLSNIPSTIIGSIFLYLMCSQIATGLLLAFGNQKEFEFSQGLTIALPLMLGTIVSFLPTNVVSSFPPFIRPLVGNGFALGVLAVLVMEHLIFKEKTQE